MATISAQNTIFLPLHGQSVNPGLNLKQNCIAPF